MKENIYISGFADEISPDFTEQLKTVTSLGMHYISLRSADGKNIAEYTPDEVREKLMPRLAQYGVKVSSIGSPVGKVGVEDEAGFAEHLAGLERLCEICKLLDCRYIRMFSFFIPHGKDPDSYRDVVIEKGAKVEDCIIMEGGRILSDASLRHVITDRNVIVRNGRTMMGHENYPITIAKNATV